MQISSSRPLNAYRHLVQIWPSWIFTAEIKQIICDIICSGKQVKEMKALEINSRRHCTEIRATKQETRSAFATVENLTTFFLILRTKLNSLNLKKNWQEKGCYWKYFYLLKRHSHYGLCCEDYWSHYGALNCNGWNEIYVVIEQECMFRLKNADSTRLSYKNSGCEIRLWIKSVRDVVFLTYAYWRYSRLHIIRTVPK